MHNAHLGSLIIEVMLPIILLVAAGGLWPHCVGAAPLMLRRQLSQLAFNLFVPALMFAIGATAKVNISLLTVPLLFAIGVLLTAALLYALLFRSGLATTLPPVTRVTLLIGGMFGNTFYIGLPVLTHLYGAQAARYPAYNDVLAALPLVWGLGVWLINRLGATATSPSLWRVLLTLPPIWGFIAGVTLHFSGWTPKALVDAANFIGQATVPVMLFVLGLSIPWKRLRPNRYLIGIAASKLLLTPALVWIAALLLFHPPAEPQRAAVLESAMPTFLFLIVLAERFHRNMETAALLVGWSTVLMWLTLPWWMWVVR